MSTTGTAGRGGSIAIAAQHGSGFITGIISPGTSGPAAPPPALQGLTAVRRRHDAVAFIDEKVLQQLGHPELVSTTSTTAMVLAPGRSRCVGSASDETSRLMRAQLAMIASALSSLLEWPILLR